MTNTRRWRGEQSLQQIYKKSITMISHTNQKFLQGEQKSQPIRCKNKLRSYEYYEEGGRSFRRLLAELPRGSRLTVAEVVAQAEARAREEYDMQAECSCEHVIRNYEYRFQAGCMSFLQEDFDCLLSDLPTQDLCFEDRLTIFYHVVLGVKAIHAKQICIRTLGMDNVSLTVRDGKIIAKVNDFEHAVRLDSKNPGSKLEIPSNQSKNQDIFTSPEVKFRKPYSLSADIWSLGALLCQLLYNTTRNIWEENKEIKIEVPQGTPQWLFELLKFMLHYRPECRHSIDTVESILRVAMRCLHIMKKYVPLNDHALTFNKTETNYEWNS